MFSSFFFFKISAYSFAKFRKKLAEQPKFQVILRPKFDRCNTGNLNNEFREVVFIP